MQGVIEGDQGNIIRTEDEISQPPLALPCGPLYFSDPKVRNLDPSKTGTPIFIDFAYVNKPR